MLTLDEISQMPLKEKVMTMEALWRSLSSNEDEVEVPQWHKDLLDAREAKIRSGQAEFVPWDEAKRQIDSACR